MIGKILGEIIAVAVAALLTRQLGLAVIEDPDLYVYVTAGVAIGALAGLFAHHIIVPRLNVRQLAIAVAAWVVVTLGVYLAYQFVWGDSASHAEVRRNTAKFLAFLLGFLGSFATAPPAAAASDRMMK